MAHPEEPQRALTEPSAPAVVAAPPRAFNPALAATLWLLATIVGVLTVYAMLTAQGRWFPGVNARTFALSDFALTRGTGGISPDPILGDAFLLLRGDDTGLTLLSVNTDFASTDYPVVAFTGTHFPENASVRLLWRTSYAPNRVFSVPVPLAGGRLTPVSLASNPDWVGKVSGLALAVNGTLTEPARVTGLVVKPGGVLGQVRELLHEWFAYERWSGTSINTVTGGADVQALPLPPLLMVSAVLAGVLCIVLAWRKRGRTIVPLVAGVLFVLAWTILDVQWSWNLARQVTETRTQYGGKDWRERHLAADDAGLFEFVEKARALLPATPARIFVLADAAYFRGRGAYHLYPHNVLFDPFYNTLPANAWLRPGDYVLVYNRKGVQYDARAKRLRFDNGEPVPADALLVGQGAALFRIG